MTAAQPFSLRMVQACPGWHRQITSCPGIMGTVPFGSPTAIARNLDDPVSSHRNCISDCYPSKITPHWPLAYAASLWCAPGCQFSKPKSQYLFSIATDASSFQALYATASWQGIESERRSASLSCSVFFTIVRIADLLFLLPFLHSLLNFCMSSTYSEGHRSHLRNYCAAAMVAG